MRVDDITAAFKSTYWDGTQSFKSWVDEEARKLRESMRGWRVLPNFRSPEFTLYLDGYEKAHGTKEALQAARRLLEGP